MSGEKHPGSASQFKSWELFRPLITQGGRDAQWLVDLPGRQPPRTSLRLCLGVVGLDICNFQVSTFIWCSQIRDGYRSQSNWLCSCRKKLQKTLPYCIFGYFREKEIGERRTFERVENLMSRVKSFLLFLLYFWCKVGIPACMNSHSTFCKDDTILVWYY